MSNWDLNCLYFWFYSCLMLALWANFLLIFCCFGDCFCSLFGDIPLEGYFGLFMLLSWVLSLRLATCGNLASLLTPIFWSFLKFLMPKVFILSLIFNCLLSGRSVLKLICLSRGIFLTSKVGMLATLLDTRGSPGLRNGSLGANQLLGPDIVLGLALIWARCRPALVFFVLLFKASIAFWEV